MITTLNPQFGHFLVRKFRIVLQMRVPLLGGLTISEHTNKNAYGVFRIDHKTTGYLDGPEVKVPADTNKVHLTPVGFKCFEERDWYTCDVLKFGEAQPAYQVFDNYAEALNWANSMNNIKDVE